MSTAGLFTIGVLVTLIVAAAMALLIYAAILDGRDAAARRTADRALTRGVSILQTARAAGSLGILVTAIDRAGLSDLLEHEGPYTVFAPSDEAFAGLPDGAVQSLLAAPDTLADVVNYHLVPGRMTAADVAGRISAETLQGEDLAISNHGVIRIDGARLVSGDLEASNGVIHVIDRVLLPARI
ncbi:MAG TPA: fasciclin domain-containing protein [Solirubrobacteraceae bacterium]|nr:fasciclin domain-containing protein [Solirubrobacteraceae bacterium]